MAEQGSFEEGLSAITELGFDQATAVETLSLFNGDVEQAVNYLFADDAEKAMIKESRELQLQSHADIPPGIINGVLPPPEYAMSEQEAQKQHVQEYSAPPVPPRSTYQTSHVEDIRDPSNRVVMGLEPTVVNMDYHPQPQSEYTVYDDIHKYTRKTDSPAVLMPLKNGQYESYLNALIMMLHEIPALKKAVYKHKFDTLGFHSRWYKGEPVSVPPETSIIHKEGEEDHDAKFLLEVQRLFGFLDGDSNRAFASVKNFTKSFPKKALQKFADVDTLADAYQIFTMSLIDDLKAVGVENAEQLFVSKSLDTQADDQEPLVVPFGMLPIEGEDMKSNIHETLSAMLWSDASVPSTIDSFADIVPISIEPAFESLTSVPNFHLDQEFHPQIYTREYGDLVYEMSKESDSLDRERRTLLQQMSKLKSHRGKHANGALNSTIEFLRLRQERDPTPELERAIEKLTSVKDEVEKRSAALQRRQEEIVELSHKADYSNLNTVLERIGKELESYVLTGVIVSPQMFAYVRKTGEKGHEWIAVEFDAQGNDFRTMENTFDDIVDYIKYLQMGKLQTPVVLLYVRQSVFLDSDTNVEVPPAVRDFIEKDKVELEKSMELLDSSSDEDVEEEYVQATGQPLSTRQEESDYDEMMTREEEPEDLIELDTPVTDKPGETLPIDSVDSKEEDTTPNKPQD